MDKKDFSVRDSESSASKALQRVKQDPDNSGRSRQTSKAVEQPAASRLAKQGQPVRKKASGTKKNVDRSSAPKAKPQEGRPSSRAEGERSEIRINKRMRKWNKYKNYVFSGIGILVALIVLVTSVKSCAKHQREEEESLYSKPSMGALQVTGEASDNSQQAPSEEQTPAVSKNMVLTTTRTATSESFTEEAFFENSVFVGDAIASGISYYKFLNSANVVSDNNLTASKAADKVKDITDKNPQKVFIMLGINDLNYNTKTPDTIAGDFVDLINQIRQALPSTNIYVVSVTPVTKSFESKSSTYVKMSNVEALNAKLKEMATSSNNFYFVDINSALQDSSGYMNSDITGNGYGLKSTYYGFLLNTIAEMAK